MIATVAEKLYGTAYAMENIYHAEWMIALWGVATTTAIVYILQRKLHRQPVTLCLHLAFAVILIGALTTHINGKRGEVHLREGEYTNIFILPDGSLEKLPFSFSLHDFNVERHAGTKVPMDFTSTVIVYDRERIEGNISMNNIFKYKGYRFYQSGYDDDEKGTFLSISHDPWGIGITYAGYILLLLSLLLFFFQPHSHFRAIMSKVAQRRSTMAMLILTAVTAANADNSPRTLPADVAERFCDIHVQHNGRICPLQTLAIDFTTKIHGKSSYNDYTAEQVLCGWLFFYDEWEHEPMIEIKDGEVKRVLGINGNYAALAYFTDQNGYKLEKPLREKGNASIGDFVVANEKVNVLEMLRDGSLLKIFPHKNSIDNETEWYSFANEPTEIIPNHASMNFIAELAASGNYEGIEAVAESIKSMQTRKGGESVPSPTAFMAEKLYNSINGNKPIAIACLITGTLLFMLFCYGKTGNRTKRIIELIAKITAWIIATYFLLQILLRWYISGYFPLANGGETMIFMAWCSMLLTALSSGRTRFVKPFGYLVCGFTLLVAGFGESTPQITPIMPVLNSPLLCIHVVVIMVSYTLLAFTMLGGIAAFITKATRRDAEKEIIELQHTSMLVLYPAVFLLTAGIFIGAVWANVSWGRYWGWDPKEVWALITLLVYSAALHSGSIKAMRRPMFFHAYCIAAFLAVLITYFGVNFVLGGMHSYA